MTNTTDQLAADVEVLCDPAHLPRNPGTAGGRHARRYLTGRLSELGLTPAGEEGFEQPIPPIGGANLLASIPGSGTGIVVLGAHHDAFGHSNPGADDNAAGVAIALAVADRLRSADLDRTVLLALFDAEEPPNFLSPTMGSNWWVEHPTVPLADVHSMVCLDLVGHTVGPLGAPAAVAESVFVLGAELSAGTGPLVDALPKRPGIRPRRIDNHVIPSMSDYNAFLRAEIPFLFYTAGRWAHYHQPTDTPDRLDYEKMVALVDHLTDAVSALANRPDRPGLEPGFDDAATIGSLLGLVEPLAGLQPAAEAARRALEELAAAAAEQGALDPNQRRSLAEIGLGLEQALA